MFRWHVLDYVVTHSLVCDMTFFICLDHVGNVYRQAISKGSIAYRQFFKKEMMLAKVVMDTCTKVLTGTADELAVFKKTFTASSGTSEVSAGSTTGSVQVLGAATPTKTFADLVAMVVCRAHPVTVYEQVVEKDDYKKVRKDLTEMLAPIKDLVGAVKAQVQRIKTRRDAHVDLQGSKFGDVSAPKVLDVC